MTLEKRKRGEVIIRQGDRGDTFYVVSEGRCECKRDDTEAVLSTLRKGDSFGEGALLDDAPRAVTVIATKPTELLALPRGVYRDFVQSRSRDAHVTVMKRKMVGSLTTEPTIHFIRPRDYHVASPSRER